MVVYFHINFETPLHFHLAAPQEPHAPLSSHFINLYMKSYAALPAFQQNAVGIRIPSARVDDVFKFGAADACDECDAGGSVTSSVSV